MNGGEVVFNITADNDDAKKKLNETEKTAEDMAGNVAEAVKKIASALALAKGAQFLADITKQCVQAYADFEQLTGGVETLFKDASDTVKKNAQEAFLSVGMSANEYMETVTGFSASLIASLDGDTAKAAEKADQALTQMVDNASKMGSDLESIKNAYAGFAKGQFTMLDNLKLGYGGTKTEMERLLQDAQAISGIKYDIDSYADIIDAIGIIQDKMHITGTTAKEASETITGSIQAMKASWQNLLVGIADPEQSVADLTKQLTDSIQTVEQNVMPRLIEIFGNMGDTASNLANGVLPMIPQAITALLPSVVDGLGSILDAVISNGSDLASAVLDYTPKFIESIGTISSDLGPVVLDALTKLADSASDNADIIIDTLIDTVVGLLEDDFPKLITGGARQGIKIVKAIAHGIVDHSDEIANAVPEIAEALGTAFVEILPDLIDMGKEIIFAVAEGAVKFDYASWGLNIAYKLIDALGIALEAVEAFQQEHPILGGALGGAYTSWLSEKYDNTGWKQIAEEFAEEVRKTQEQYEEWWDAGAKELNILTKYKNGIKKRSEPIAADMSDYAASLKAQSEQWRDDAEDTAENVTAAGETLNSALEALENKYAIHQLTEEQYWSQRKAILEQYRDESDAEWWKLYDAVTEHYDKLAETERKAAESAAREQERAVKDNVEKRFRDLETTQLEEGYDESWLLEQEEAFIETLDHDSDLYADYHLKLLKTKQQYQERTSREAEKAADNERKSMEKMLETVKKSQEKLSESLDFSGKDLFKKEETTDKHTGVKTTKRTVDIAEFEKQLAAKKKLTSKIAELLNAGVSDELIRELLKLDPTDALAYATSLLSNPTKLERIKKDFSQDEELSDKLAEMVTKQSSEYADLGKMAGETFGEGFLEALGPEWQEKLAQIVGNSSVYAAATTAMKVPEITKAGVGAIGTAGAGLGMVNAVLGGDLKLKLVDADGKYVATLVNTENSNTQIQRGT